MSSVGWKRELPDGTRGKIMGLLRRARRTIKELAGALDLTENAVRVHLATLQRDGLVEQGVRRTPGAGKPAYEYRLTPQAQRFFPVAHELVLDTLLSELEKQMDPAELDRLLHAIGRSMASRYPIPSNGLRMRLEQAISALDSMGGVVELEEEDEMFRICAYACPLAAIPQSHPEVCVIVQAMLAAMLAAPMRERCERSEEVACRFEVPKT